jgi:hypothetical protein
MSEVLLQEWPTDRICVLRMSRPDAYDALSRALLLGWSCAPPPELGVPVPQKASTSTSIAAV